ncbi:MAG: thioredoxin family protein [Bacteroidales bacterium]|nr:thioredoxin family protein [Bacteroidales bacterium]
MFTRLFLSLVLLLQAAPQIFWKSEIQQTPDGDKIVLTGELEPGIDHVSGTVTYMPCKGDACYMPVDWDFDEFIELNGTVSAPGSVSLRETPPTALGGGALPLTEPRAATVSGTADGSAQQSTGAGSLWALILEAILWGFAMLLTPCVFPMVPMTVSFFMKGSDNPGRGRLKAALYGLFIVLLYTVPISIIIGITWMVGGSGVTADIFNWLSTHWLPNLLFFLVFMAFAASFFGAFEITLPSKWTNDADKNSDRAGLGGIFFLALTLVLVSFSCTGPIVGTVLIKSTQGEFWTPMVTMLAFSVAFALPFTVLALFPALLKKLPKSGGWLNSVKVVLGFVEIALGLKFLSTADQTYHWHLLDREVYLAIWIAVFTLLGLYLIGKIRFKNDSPLEYLSVPRLTLAIVVFSFVVYLIPGMWGAPLKALSGYLPPMETQDFVIKDAPLARTSDAGTVSLETAQEEALGNITIAHGLRAFDNLPDALAASKTTGKPVFLDFTGYGCVNCREMEARVWSDPEVLRRLREEFIIAALHVDDKTKLPEEKWVLNERGKPLKDVGRVNSYIALHDFGVNAQPNYFLLDSDGGRIAGPRPYNLDVQEFIKFLDAAL